MDRKLNIGEAKIIINDTSTSCITNKLKIEHHPPPGRSCHHPHPPPPIAPPTTIYTPPPSTRSQPAADEELRDDLLEPWFVERLKVMEKPSEMKKYAQDCLLVCSAEDNNCPFILSNLTFPHFSNFLSTRTSRKGKNKGKPNSLSVASYDQAKSALVHLFRMSKYCIPGEFAENLRIFMKGMKRHVATKKMEG